MGTIDMSHVAGFKAVDAEGNELGVVSMSELTASISEQVLQTIAMRNQATTLEQPALMSAASTLAAGNDAYENELPEQTDLKWARALDASGNPILISKESLASVVGGLLETDKTLKSSYNINNSVDLKTLGAGIYSYFADASIPSDMPSGSSSGVLVVFKPNGYTRTQIVFDFTIGIKHRVSKDNGDTYNSWS